MGLAFRHKYNRYKGIPLIQHGDGYKGYHNKKKKGQGRRGFGSFFKNLAKKAAPALKNFAKNTAADLIPLAANTAMGLMTGEKGTRKDIAKDALMQAFSQTKVRATKEAKKAMGMSAFPSKGGRVQKRKGKKGKKGKKRKKNQEGSGVKYPLAHMGDPNIFFPV